MEKKSKIHLTNEEMKKKFKSSFELVNYAIKLAENMIKSGRDARVKSDVQNRAMLILEEIHEGKDHFDDIDGSGSASTNDLNLDGEFKHLIVYEEVREDKKYRTANALDGDQ